MNELRAERCTRASGHFRGVGFVDFRDVSQEVLARICPAWNTVAVLRHW
ncbi:hypothetical protein [Rhodococcus sp. 27YEA15]